VSVLYFYRKIYNNSEHHSWSCDARKALKKSLDELMLGSEVIDVVRMGFLKDE
jgi:hypothetical protein